MRQTMLNESGNGVLVIFFNDWGLDEKVLSHLDPGTYGLLEIRNYRTLENPPDVLELSRKYDEIRLIAWSFGVFAATASLGNLKEYLHSCLAVNGTPQPADPRYGVDADFFRMTQDNWLKEEFRLDYYRKMAGADEIPQQMTLPERLPEHQLAELQALPELFSERRIDDDFYDCAVIGSRDGIFLPERQKAFFEPLSTRCIELDVPHLPFAGFETLQEVLDLGEEE